MKKCELCESPAKMFCESDQASLCWDCDAKVHGANFLVAKHSRALLCHVCQSLTPWNGSGPKLGRSVSVCNVCVNNGSASREEINYTNYSNGESHSDEDEEDDGGDEDEDEEEEDDDEENQVVPWSTSTPQPQVSGSSTNGSKFSGTFCIGKMGNSESRIASFYKKRMRDQTTN